MDSPYRVADLWGDVRSDLCCCRGTGLADMACAICWGTGFQLLFTYRLSRWFSGRRLEVLCLPLKWLQYILSGSEISRQAVLGRCVHLPHPTGIVIGAGVVIEDDVWVFQQVTIGSHGRPGEGMRYPVIGRGARIYAGAKVIGGISIGAGAMVGANSVVLHDVPDGATAVGVPARVVRA